MGAPTRFPNGLTTTTKNSPLGEFILPDMTTAHVYFEDFDYFAAANWIITTVEDGAGAATEALADEDGGVLLITNDDADDDSDFFNKDGESFLMAAGKQAWFSARLKVSDATQSDWIMGLQITDTTPLAVTDGIFFRKDDGDTNIDFVVIKDSVATTVTGAGTNADDTYVTLSFYYDGKSRIRYFVDGVMQGSTVTDNLPDDEVLTVSFGIQNGEAVAKTMSVDYILAAKER